MGLTHALIILIALVLHSSSSYSPPAVSSLVADILTGYDDYVHYNGSVIDSHAFTIQHASYLESRDASYWYEQIPHRGISAFGPAGYQVYRNVKDYGARGQYTFSCQDEF